MAGINRRINEERLNSESIRVRLRQFKLNAFKREAEARDVPVATLARHILESFLEHCSDARAGLSKERAKIDEKHLLFGKDARKNKDGSVSVDCKLCGGGYNRHEVAYSYSDNSCDIGPVCVGCMQVLLGDPTVAHLLAE